MDWHSTHHVHSSVVCHRTGSRRCSVADDPAALAAEADVWAAECAALAARIAGEEAALFQAGRMMAMYVNRGNGRYFEEHQWRNPEVFNITQLAGFAGEHAELVLVTLHALVLAVDMTLSAFIFQHLPLLT